MKKKNKGGGECSFPDNKGKRCDDQSLDRRRAQGRLGVVVGSSRHTQVLQKECVCSVVEDVLAGPGTIYTAHDLRKNRL